MDAGSRLNSISALKKNNLVSFDVQSVKAKKNEAWSEHKHSLTFHVRRYVVIANPCTDSPNSAQLEGTPTIRRSYIRVRAVMWDIDAVGDWMSTVLPHMMMMCS